MNDTQSRLIDRGDLDGFFGLLIDNLVQILMIVSLCGLCGIGPDSELLLDYILPGAAVSILIGNLFYAWQAKRLARKENRDDVTALPYGINTPSLLVFIFFVMKPAYDAQISAEVAPDAAARYAWQMGLIACLGSGVIEFLGSFVAEFVRVKTPRAALLSTLAGIAIGFIAMTFALTMFARPLVALVPLSLLLLTYFSKYKFPFGIPGGFLAVMVGTLIAWVCPHLLPESVAGPAMSFAHVKSSAEGIGLHLPRYAGDGLFDLILNPASWQGYLTVIVPMGLFNLIGSLQNIESAEAAGDRYHTGMSLAANGVGTISAALLGSCFPTTIYIGHPGWKELGAKANYSTWNGIVIALLAFSGGVTLVSSIIPMEAGMAIILWIGLIITAQAFQTTPSAHAPAVAMGLFPAIAAWGMVVVTGAFVVSGGRTVQELLTADGAGVLAVKIASIMGRTLEAPLSLEGGIMGTYVNGFLLHGLILLERGYIFTCMLLAAIGAELIERRYFQAAFWSGIAAVGAYLGLMHSYQVSDNQVDFYFPLMQNLPESSFGFEAIGLATGYTLFGLIFFAVGWSQRTTESGAITNAE